MNMGTFIPQEPHQSVSEASVSAQVSQSSLSSFGRNITRSFSLVSQLFSHKISHEEKITSDQKENTQLMPELPIIPQTPLVSEKIKSNSRPDQMSQFEVKEQAQQTATLTLDNFQDHLMRLWKRDPTLSSEEFFKLATKLFIQVKDDKKMYVNFNKIWCKRFIKNQELKYAIKASDAEQLEMKEEKEEELPQTFYSMVQDAEYSPFQHNITNTSELWQNHTKKLFEKNKSKLGRKATSNENIWLVNESAIKTLKNRRSQIAKIETYLSKSQVRNRRIREIKTSNEIVIDE